MRGRPNKRDGKMEEILSLYKVGYSITDISKLVALSDTTVRTCLIETIGKDSYLKLKPPRSTMPSGPPRKYEQQREMVNFFLAGARPSVIAKCFTMTRERVRQILNQAMGGEAYQRQREVITEWERNKRLEDKKNARKLPNPVRCWVCKKEITHFRRRVFTQRVPKTCSLTCRVEFQNHRNRYDIEQWRRHITKSIFKHRKNRPKASVAWAIRELKKLGKLPQDYTWRGLGEVRPHLPGRRKMDSSSKPRVQAS